MTMSISSKAEGSYRTLTVEQKARIASLRASLGEVDSLAKRVQHGELLVNNSIDSVRATIQSARTEVATATKVLVVSGVVLGAGSTLACFSAAQSASVSGGITSLSGKDISSVLAKEPVATEDDVLLSFPSENTEGINIERASAQKSVGGEKSTVATRMRKMLARDIGSEGGRCAGEPEGIDRDRASQLSANDPGVLDSFRDRLDAWVERERVGGEGNTGESLRRFGEAAKLAIQAGISALEGDIPGAVITGVEAAGQGFVGAMPDFMYSREQAVAGGYAGNSDLGFQ